MKSLLIICIILCIVSSTMAQNRVVCYWDSTSTRHVGLLGYFTVADIDPTLCTHIVFTYIKFLDRGEGFIPYDEDTMRSFINLKQRAPNVKLLLGVGGPDQKGQIPSFLASTQTDRRMSAERVRDLINQYGFDGADFDWQYPNQGPGTSSSDKANFVALLSTWRQTLTSSKLLTVSVAPRQRDIDLSYDINGILEHVDFINLNSYSLRGSANDTVTAFHSPYRKAPGNTGAEADWNIESIVDNWIARGYPRSRLTLGIATYGKSYTLSDVSRTGLGAPVSGVGKKSSFLSNNAGIVPYAEICHGMLNADWQEIFDEQRFTPYITFDSDQWVSYDSQKTVLAKIHLAKDKGLGGINYATIDRDDFSNLCGDGKFPLLKIGYDAVVNDRLESNPVNQDQSTTTEATTTTTTTKASTTSTTTTQRPASTTTTPAPTTTTPRSTTKTTTTTKLPDSNTSPIYTGSSTAATVTKLPDDVDFTTTTKPTTVAITNFPTPPTLNGLATESTGTTAGDSRTPPPSTTTRATTTKKKTTTTTTPFHTPPVTPHANALSIEAFVCPAAGGSFANPSDCTTFYICEDNVAYKVSCITGMHFNSTNDRCEDASSVPCVI